MKIFVTGASGWIGSATTAELLAAGHQVLGLARSDASADTIAAAGAQVLRGDIDDLDSLRKGAEQSDGVVHMAYNHDFSQMEAAARTDEAAIGAIGDVLAGSNRPFAIASGVIGMAADHIITEQDTPDPATHPRVANAAATLALADRGVRSIVVRFAPTVHGPGDHGFIARLVEIAREQKVSGYVGDGTNTWPAVHRSDAGLLVRLAVEKATPGSVWHAVAEEGVALGQVAEVIGRHLDLPVVSVPAERALERFGWLGRFLGLDTQVSSARTQQLLDWAPTHPGLLADLEQGSYFR